MDSVNVMFSVWPSWEREEIQAVFFCWKCYTYVNWIWITRFYVSFPQKSTGPFVHPFWLDTLIKFLRKGSSDLRRHEKYFFPRHLIIMKRQMYVPTYISTFFAVCSIKWKEKIKVNWKISEIHGGKYLKYHLLVCVVV